MEVRKYFSEYSNIAMIKTDTYQHSLVYILRLFEIAKQDYPELQEKDVNIKVYNDDRWGKQTGIEFKVKSKLDDYVELAKLPYTFN